MRRAVSSSGSGSAVLITHSPHRGAAANAALITASYRCHSYHSAAVVPKSTSPITRTRRPGLACSLSPRKVLMAVGVRAR